MSTFRSLALVLPLLLGLQLGCSSDGDTPDAGPVDAGPRCANDEQCAADQHCDDTTKVCVAGNGNECEMDSECGDGRMCEAVTNCGLSRCRKRCAPATCTDHEDCGSWVCISGTCAEPPSCAGGAACPGDLVCDAATDTCGPAPAMPCTMDAECTGNQICYGGFCGDQIACVRSSECPAGLSCVMDACRDPCTATEQCGSMLMWMCQAGDCVRLCLDDNSCPATFICEGNNCVDAQCTTDAECTGADEECVGEENGHGRCIGIVMCTDDSMCPVNFTCDPNGRCVELPACLNDRECGATGFCQDRHCQPAADCSAMSCGAGLECVGDKCVPFVCRWDASCATGEVCVGGACVTPPAATTVTDVRILSPAGAIRVGETHRFVAVATNAQDNIVPGVEIEWASSMTAIATIDAAGVATAVAIGTTNITARVNNGTTVVTSAPVPVRVFSQTSKGFRVTVVSDPTGLPVEAATVVCGSSTQMTNASGTTAFALTPPQTCTVFTPDHAWVTGVNLSDPDVMFRLPPRAPSNVASGFTGPVDTAQVPGMAPVQLSFTIGAFAGSLSAFQPARLFGGDQFTADLPVVGAIALPSGMTAAAVIQGFPISLKDAFYSGAEPGPRMVASFAGRAELNDLGLQSGDLLRNVLPLFQTFRQEVNPRIRTLAALPTIVDAGDFDGDGDTTELVPDYVQYAAASFAPMRQQRLRMFVNAAGATVPTGADALMVVTGAILPGVGFVPLGLDGVGVPGANVGAFTTALAPRHAGLEAGELAVMLASISAAAGELPRATSARIAVGAELTTIDATDGWLAFPTATFDGTARSLNVTAAGDVWRARFRGAEGTWHVYAPAGTATFTLPAPPSGVTDRSTGAALVVDAADLDGDMGALFHSSDFARENHQTRGFAQTVVR